MAANFSRRAFLLSSTTAALGVMVPETASPSQGTILKGATTQKATVPASPYSTAELFKMGPQRTYSGDAATQVAMPMGGIGAGCICLNGYGGLQDFSIRHRPATTALADRHGYTDAGFALLHIQGDKPVTRLVEGPLPAFKIYDQGLQGQGFRHGGQEGLPRFAHSVFQGKYPFGEVTLTDPKLPLRVQLTGWSPFIPRDDKNSGIPCLILEYQLTNLSTQPVAFEFSYHLGHPAPGCHGAESASRSRVLPDQGILFYNTEPTNAEGFGSACLMMPAHNPLVKAMWLRSDWEFDSLSALWREISTGSFTTNSGSGPVDRSGRNGGSLLVKGNLAAGTTVTYPVLITWYFPNSYLRAGALPDPAEKQVQGTTGCRSLPEPAGPFWRPFYAGVWKDAEEVARYVTENFGSLRSRTQSFQRALFDSTLPTHVLDAVSANLGILKSPTVLRQENGNLWCWEGCFPDSGCCHGSCTHVWNYAQALPHLFPKLERTLREQEYLRSMDERGHVTFRAALPDGPVTHGFHAASDGQLGGVMKVYRDWQISGDTEWLRQMYPLVRRSLEYCIRTWDPDRQGALFEPHHNTYDIEFWGPDGMCASIYLGALSAMVQMGRALGNGKEAAEYEILSQKCAQFLDEQLFNEEYYQQKVQYQGLRNTSFAEFIAKGEGQDPETLRLLRAEGPKYQFGRGCLSDGVIGAWMARIYGIETPLRHQNVRRNLQAIFQHNFKTDLSEHANAQRPGYAMGHDPGLLLCSWPKGGKPTIPFPYSDEVWTGIEYQVASHLISEGFLQEGLTIVKAARSRYDGKVRNPWNEYECGNYYGRALSSYALLAALSGFRYSSVDQTLWFGPRLKVRPFRVFISTASGFGQIQLDNTSLQIKLIEGELSLKRLILDQEGQIREFSWDTVARANQAATLPLR
jgi:uncharacterized protein (DUF608 family)